MPRFLPLLLTLACLIPPATMAEDIVVVVAPNSGVETLTRSEVTNIFLGRYRKLPGGQSATPIDTQPLKGEFYARLVGKSLAEINAYWARLVFSGATMPPLQAVSEPAAIALITEHGGEIAYIERSKTSKQMRIVFALESTP